MAGHDFTDPISHRACTLHVQEGFMGVEHPGCDQLADVAITLDAFFCRSCTHNGRISGAWASDLYVAANGGALTAEGERP